MHNTHVLLELTLEVKCGLTLAASMISSLLMNGQDMSQQSLVLRSDKITLFTLIVFYLLMDYPNVTDKIHPLNCGSLTHWAFEPPAAVLVSFHVNAKDVSGAQLLLTDGAPMLRCRHVVGC